MKKLLIIIILFFGVSFAKANPIIVPTILITEIYFDNNDKWTMELYICTNSYSNLDSFKLCSSSGEALFRAGKIINYKDVILITQDSLQSSLIINRYSDNLQIKECFMGSWSNTYNPFAFGNSSVSFPRIGQSLEYITYPKDTIYNYFGNHFYAKSKITSFGTFPSNNSFNCLGNISGHIYDVNNNLITGNSVFIYLYAPWVTNPIDTIFVDNNGYFSKNMPACYYSFNVRNKYTNSSITYQNISLEPDSIINYDFHLNISFNGIKENLIKNSYSISNYPNPFKNNTTIEIKLEKITKISNAILKIYNNIGEIVKIIPVENYNSTTNTCTVEYRNKTQVLEAGIYYYTLEIDGKKVASNKMTIIK